MSIFNLSEDDIDAIKRAVSDGECYNALAERYKVSYVSIGFIADDKGDSDG